MANRRFVAYHRASTKQQELSGLEFEAQEAAVRRHLDPGFQDHFREVTAS